MVSDETNKTRPALGLLNIIFKTPMGINTFKYHVFVPIGRFQLELIYLPFNSCCFCPVGLSLLIQHF